MSAVKAPGWGKTIGILMIILGSLGVFYQMYRIAFPKILNFQNKMMHTITDMQKDAFNQIDENDTILNKEELNQFITEPLQQFDHFRETIFGLDDQTTNYLTWFSLIMIVLCIVYIIAGTKIMKPSIQNYNMAVYTLVASIVINLISYVLIFTGQNSFMIMAIMFYSFIGVVADVVFLIIAITSDKSAYGFDSKTPSAIDSEFS